MAEQKYRIERHSEDHWWDWLYPPPGWWLIYNGKAQVYRSWKAAVAGMYRHAKRRKKEPADG